MTSWRSAHDPAIRIVDTTAVDTTAADTTATGEPAVDEEERVRHRHAVVVAIVLAVLGTACGSSGGSRADTSPTRTGNGTGAAPTTAGAEVNPSGDIPDNQAFVAFTPPGGGYTLEVPEGWARTEAGGAVSFTDKLNTVRVESRPTPSPPTVESATRDEVPAVRAASRGFVAGQVTTVARAGGTAVLVTYRAESPPDPVTGKTVPDAVERYEFWRAGTEVVVTLSAPVGADNVDPWRRVTDSFRWTP